MDNLLEEIKYNLYDIHDKLYGGDITINDLKGILKQLNILKELIEEIQHQNSYTNKLINNILIGFKLILSILPILFLALILTNVLNIVLGIIFILTTLLFNRELNRTVLLEKNEELRYEQLMEKIIEDIEYKKEITNKKINTAKRLTSLEKETNLSYVKIPKIEKTRILKFKN